MTSRTRAALTALVLSVSVALAGCSTLPDSGPVRRQADERPDRPEDAPYFNPPGPAEDGSPSAIVSGFLVAMQANPLSTSVARTFLSEKARGTWKPNLGTIVYDAFTVTPTTPGAEVRLADPRRLDARGGWRGGPEGGAESLALRLVSEKGQWRIDNPPNALVVPTSFFDRSFARFNLYYYDQTGRVLLPDPVFVPRGDQTASNLVRGLLAGPGRVLADISRSALPARTDLALSVVVTESGVAEVPLSREVLGAPPDELDRAVDQIAATLRQVPGIERVRLTVGGVPVPLAGGRVDVAVTSGSEYDAVGTGVSTLWGVRGGRVVDLETPEPVDVGGPLGQPGYALRSFAVREGSDQIAGVSGNGTTVYVADSEQGTTSTRVTRPLTGGTDVLRPSYDMFGDLWLLDRTPRGAKVYVVRNGQRRQVRVPGVTGADVAAFSVSRDGGRMAVAFAGTPAPALRVATILRTDEGIVTGSGRAWVFDAGVADAARLVDLGWRTPGTLAVLSRPTDETSQVSFVSSDGSPASPTLVEPSIFRGSAVALVVAPDVELPIHLLTPGQRVYAQSGTGSWPRGSAKVTAAAFAP